MNKILSKEVSYRLAILLKDNKYDGLCNKIYYDGTDELRGHSHFLYSRDLKAPTIAEVVDWIYEKHDIWIDVSLSQFSKPNNLSWMYSIVFTTRWTGHSPKKYDLPLEAYEKAIEYTLKELI